MDPANYKDSQILARANKIERVLAGHTFHGLTTGEIAKATQESHSNVTRLVANLYKLGRVEETRVPGRWRLGPSFMQIALAYQADMQSTENELSGIKQRFSRKD